MHDASSCVHSLKPPCACIDCLRATILADQRKAALDETLLTELGRLHPNDMRRLAAEIDKRNLSERDATKFVKEFRTRTKKRPFDSLELSKLIAKCIDKYSETHNWTAEQLVDSVQRVLEIVSEMPEGDQ